MKGHVKIFTIAILAISCMLSCGKYGYNFQDGYQDGDENPSDINADTSKNSADKSMYRIAINPCFVKIRQGGSDCLFTDFPLWKRLSNS